jgi:hypothetical protein
MSSINFLASHFSSLGMATFWILLRKNKYARMQYNSKGSRILNYGILHNFFYFYITRILYNSKESKKVF